MSRIADSVYLTPKKEFYEKLKEVAKARGVTIEMISRVVLNQNSSYVSKSLTNRRIPEAHFYTLCDWMGAREGCERYLVNDEEEVTVEDLEKDQEDIKTALIDLIEINKSILAELQRINYVSQEIRTATRLTANNTLNSKGTLEDLLKELGGSEE